MSYVVPSSKVREEMHYLLTLIHPDSPSGKREDQSRSTGFDMTQLREAGEETLANILREEKWVEEPQAKPVVYRE